MTRLAHFQAGEGPRALLLLHGFLGSGRNLGSLARRLAARDPSLSVFALDLTGHGTSPPLPPGADLETLARDVLATAEDLGLATPLRMVGHSLGGRVALRAGLLDAAAIAHGTLLDITPSPIPVGAAETTRVLDVLAGAPERAPGRDAFRAHLRAAGLPDEIVEWLLLNLIEESGAYRWRIDRKALTDFHARMIAEDLWPAVEGPHGYGLRCIRGGLSGYVSDADARRLEAAGCPVHTIPGAGHFVHLDRPDELLDLLLGDLR